MSVFDTLNQKYSDIKFELYPKENDKSVYLTGFIVPYKLRNQGIGTKFMEDLTHIADENGYKIKLTPSSSYGGNVIRLKRFYERFGFVENKGKNKDFSHREAMHREPKTPNSLNEEISRIKSIIKTIL